MFKSKNLKLLVKSFSDGGGATITALAPSAKFNPVSQGRRYANTLPRSLLCCSSHPHRQGYFSHALSNVRVGFVQPLSKSPRSP